MLVSSVDENDPDFGFFKDPPTAVSMASFLARPAANSLLAGLGQWALVRLWQSEASGDGGRPAAAESRASRDRGWAKVGAVGYAAEM